jgi:hypothetical protein
MCRGGVVPRPGAHHPFPLTGTPSTLHPAPFHRHPRPPRPPTTSHEQLCVHGSELNPVSAAVTCL